MRTMSTKGSWPNSVAQNVSTGCRGDLAFQLDDPRRQPLLAAIGFHVDRPQRQADAAQERQRHQRAEAELPPAWR